MPKISVIIPCYNAEKYLDLCMKSVLGQTLQDIEIICVDDGSKDNTLAMLHGYAAADSRVKVLCQQNKFAGVARNTGMDAASGEYFAFLDADDYYEPEGLEKAYAIAKENDLDMLKLSSSLLDDPTGEITTNAHYSHEKFPRKGEVLQFDDEPLKLLNCADVAWNGLYKAEFIRSRQLRFNDFRCVNDRSFYISCLARAQRIMVADEYLTCYRRNIPGSLVSVRHRFFECQINSYQLIRKIVQSAELSPLIQKMTMQHELNQIFIWYQKFLDAGVNTFYVEQIIRKFVSTFDAADVGKDYLSHFPFNHQLKRFTESLQLVWQKEKLSDAPAISVIVPVHNSVPYLSECLESILLQTLRDFEIICVNNGSTDASAEMLQLFAEADCRIRILELDQSGAGIARNAAIDCALGKYLVFVDSDDKISRDYLNMLYTAAQAHNADVVASPRISWSGTGSGFPMRNWIADKRLPKDQTFSYADVPDYIINFTDGAPGGKLFNREFILEHNIRYFPIKRSEDFNFIFGAILVAKRVLYVSDSGYYYRKNNPNSLESTKDETPLLFWEATEMFTENLKKLSYFDDIKRSYLNNTINRVAFNMKAVNTFSGFSAIFYKFKEIASETLELDQHESKYFFDEASYRYLMPMMQFDTPEDFLFVQYKRFLTGGYKTGANTNAVNLDSSVSYRIGRFITFIPRKVQGLLQCVRDHGFRYTVKYGFEKLLRKLR